MKLRCAVRHASLIPVLGFALILAGCGGSQKTTTGDAQRSSPVRRDGYGVSLRPGESVRVNHFPRLATMDARVPIGPIWCPALGSDRGFTGRRVDTRSLLGLPVAAANSRAQAHGCTTRIVIDDGHSRPILQDLSMVRVDLVVSHGLVTGVDVF
jgi:hypothetical protein